MRIAVADDDTDTLIQIRSVLSLAGHSCDLFANGEEIIAALKRETFDLVLLDWNMPRANGLEVIHWANSNLSDPPEIVILTSRTSKEDVVTALEAGATDYIIKPEADAVIRARVNAALRKRSAPDRERVLECDPYRFDRLTNSVTLEGREIELTPKEFSLALLLFANVGRPLSRAYLMMRVWNSSPDLSTRTLDMHVSRVRTKLALRPENGFALQTIFGFGYRLDSFSSAAH